VWDSPRGAGMHLHVGDPVMKRPSINYMKRKKASSDYGTKQCKNVIYKGWLLKSNHTLYG
jgi:hypothetical protein